MQNYKQELKILRKKYKNCMNQNCEAKAEEYLSEIDFLIKNNNLMKNNKRFINI